MTADASQRRPTILYVDDNTLLLACLGDYLQFHGYEVLRAASGDEALKQMRKHTPDLVILDPVMTGEKGLTLLKELVRRQTAARFPILVYTAHPEMEELCVAAGVADFLCKTAPEQELVRRVGSLLQPPSPTP